MPCEYITPQKGFQRAKTCGAPVSLGNFCVAHQPKPLIVAVTPVSLSWQPMTHNGKVNQAFQNACDGASTRIDAVRLNGIHTGGMPFTGNKGIHMLLHDTQPHSNNVFFYRWVGNDMLVYGVGAHTIDNKHYGLTWYTGASASVDLAKKKID